MKMSHFEVVEAAKNIVRAMKTAQQIRVIHATGDGQTAAFLAEAIKRVGTTCAKERREKGVVDIQHFVHDTVGGVLHDMVSQRMIEVDNHHGVGEVTKSLADGIAKVLAEDAARVGAPTA